MADGYKHLDSLPQEITLHIFTRLPAELVLDCKLVCRSWRNLIRIHANDTYFSDKHIQQQHGCGLKEQNDDGSDAARMSFVSHDIKSQALYYSEYREIISDKQPIYRTRRINLKFPVRMFCLVGSCNGLICLSSQTNYSGISLSTGNYSSPREPSYICNPITREFVNLPPICIDKEKKHMGVKIVCGFGYHPLTKEYKVVRISYIGAANKLVPSRGLVEIYTLGSGKGWRIAGETELFLKYSYDNSGVCVSGSLYWVINKESAEIVAFDLEHEKFNLVNGPPCGLIRRMCVMRSCLCLITHPEMSSYFYDLWLSKENKDDESISSYRRVEEPCKSRIWSEPISVYCYLNGETTSYGFIALTKEKEFLLLNNKKIILYNSNTKATTTLWVPNDNNLDQEVPVSHINSFISLRALGERYVEKIIVS